MNQLLKDNFSDNFKGVWIPREIFYSAELSLREKFILAEIEALSKDGYCFANNAHFATLCSCARETISRDISRLKKLGYVSAIKKPENTKRYLKLNITIDSQKTSIDEISMGA